MQYINLIINEKGQLNSVPLREKPHRTTVVLK